MVGDDAADKAGVGVPQSGHELGERLLVELPHCTEHSLFGFIGCPESCLIHSCHLVQAYDAVHWQRKEEKKNCWRTKTSKRSRVWLQNQWQQKRSHDVATWRSAHGWRRQRNTTVKQHQSNRVKVRTFTSFMSRQRWRWGVKPLQLRSLSLSYDQEGNCNNV